jgi:hypothetical protein
MIFVDDTDRCDAAYVVQQSVPLARPLELGRAERLQS